MLFGQNILRAFQLHTTLFSRHISSQNFSKDLEVDLEEEKEDRLSTCCRVDFVPERNVVVEDFSCCGPPLPGNQFQRK